HALATHYVDAATDLVAAAREGLAESRAAEGAGPGLARGGRALTACQGRYNVIVEQFASRLASYGRLRRLRRLGPEKGGAWRDGAAQVKRAVARCGRPMGDVHGALYVCWQEVAGRVGPEPVALQAAGLPPPAAPAGRPTEVEAVP